MGTHYHSSDPYVTPASDLLKLGVQGLGCGRSAKNQEEKGMLGPLFPPT